MTRGGLDGVTTAHLQYFHAILLCVLSKLFMAALSRCGHYIFALWFLLSFFFSSPNLSRRTLDVYHTFTHGVARLNANLECRSEMCWCCTWLAENTGRKMAKNSPSGLHHTTLLGCVFATRARIDNLKKNLLNSNISST